MALSNISIHCQNINVQMLMRIVVAVATLKLLVLIQKKSLFDTRITDSGRRQNRKAGRWKACGKAKGIFGVKCWK